jgi:hypothetical protein
MLKGAIPTNLTPTSGRAARLSSKYIAEFHANKLKRRFGGWRLTFIALVLGATVGATSSVTAASVRGSAGAAAGNLIGNTQYSGDSFATSTPGPHTASHSFQQVFNNANNEPRLGLLASATITAEIGRLAAYASAESDGSTFLGAPQFVSAGAEGTAFDRFRVRSTTLALGTPVELSFDLVVGGNGRFDARYLVTQVSSFDGNPLNGQSKGLTLSLSGSFSDSGGQTTGTIQALVGERYKLEYSLGVTALVSTSNQTGGERFSVSDYSHTAHYYATPALTGVTLFTESGFDYTAPAPVPLPAVGWTLLLPAFWIKRKRHTGSTVSYRTARGI